MLKFNIFLSATAHRIQRDSLALAHTEQTERRMAEWKEKNIFSVIFTTIFILSRKPITLSSEWKEIISWQTFYDAIPQFHSVVVVIVPFSPRRTSRTFSLRMATNVSVGRVKF